jgi:molybdopterin converting factor small subunit
MSSSAPSVTVFVPPPLRRYCDGAATLDVAAPDVRAVLDELARLHPSLYSGVCDEQGAVRRHVNLFVNMDHVRDRDGLATRLAPGDEVTILPAVSGG